MSAKIRRLERQYSGRKRRNSPKIYLRVESISNRKILVVLIADDQMMKALMIRRQKLDKKNAETLAMIRGRQSQHTLLTVDEGLMMDRRLLVKSKPQCQPCCPLISCNGGKSKGKARQKGAVVVEIRGQWIWYIAKNQLIMQLTRSPKENFQSVENFGTRRSSEVFSG